MSSEAIFKMETILRDLKDNFNDLRALFIAHDSEIPISINVLDNIGWQIDELQDIMDTDDED